MLHTNGIPPKLNGYECEALICQQYWRDDKLEQELDVLFILSHGRWFQLYFEDSVVYWRPQDGPPESYAEKDGDRFSFPLVDLGRKYSVQGQLIEDYSVEPMIGGVKVRFEFERGDMLVCFCVDNQTRIQHIKS